MKPTNNFGHDHKVQLFDAHVKVIHPKYCKQLKKAAQRSHLDRSKMSWFLADLLAACKKKVGGKKTKPT